MPLFQRSEARGAGGDDGLLPDQGLGGAGGDGGEQAAQQVDPGEVRLPGVLQRGVHQGRAQDGGQRAASTQVMQVQTGAKSVLEF